MRSTIGDTCVSELVKEIASMILTVYRRGTNSFDELTNAVYAMVCAIKKIICKKNSNNKPPKENRRIVECEQQLRKLRQKEARASNEVHRRKYRRKLTKKERSIIKTLRKQANSKLEDDHQLRLTKEKWL